MDTSSCISTAIGVEYAYEDLNRPLPPVLERVALDPRTSFWIETAVMALRRIKGIHLCQAGSFRVLRRWVMLISYRGVVDGGWVRLREAVTLPEGTEVIVTVLSTELAMGEPTDEELAHLAMTGGAFDWLKDEPELYTDADLVERFPWAR